VDATSSPHISGFDESTLDLKYARGVQWPEGQQGMRPEDAAERVAPEERQRTAPRAAPARR